MSLVIDLIGSVVTREEVEDGLFRALNVELAAGSHMPDTKIDDDAAAFKTAMDALIAGANTIIGLKGAGTPIEAQGADHNIINIQYNEVGPGDWSKFYEYFDGNQPSDPVDYSWFKVEGYIQDMEYSIRYSTEESKNDLLMHDIILKALGRRKYIPSIQMPGFIEGQKYFLDWVGSVDISSRTFFERIFRYVVKDVWLIPPELLDASRKSAEQIGAHLNDAKFGDDVCT